MRTVGRSREGRALEAECIGPPDAICAALIFGAIHGDEPESAELCRRFLARLRLAPPTAARVIVLPVANPDGLHARTKDNARGVDLNRNFPAKSWSRDHPPRYFPGDAPLSEPESQALAELIAVEKPRVLVAVHQPLRCVNWDGPAEELAARMSAACGYPAVASVGYPTPGSFGACYGIDGARPVITLELPRTVGDADYAGCLAALDCATIATL
ncbi:MAG TPA: M14 family zinc carboxypeptidase [Polyangia bacterium]|nr:M14 family zinc carboxypeptidase [Polyangia bacterium]